MYIEHIEKLCPWMCGLPRMICMICMTGRGLQLEPKPSKAQMYVRKGGVWDTWMCARKRQCLSNKSWHRPLCFACAFGSCRLATAGWTAWWLPCSRRMRGSYCSSWEQKRIPPQPQQCDWVHAHPLCPRSWLHKALVAAVASHQQGALVVVTVSGVLMGA